MVNLSYNLTPLMEQLHRRLLQQKHPNAFAIANFGDGPILTYRGIKTRVSLLSISITNGNQHIELSQRSTPPYLTALAQEKPGQPILTAIYLASQDPVLEQSTEHRLTGQVFAYSQSPDGASCTLAHALYLSEHSHLFASTDRYNSLLLEGHPELCSHLLLCGEMIDSLLHEEKKGGTYEA